MTAKPTFTFGIPLLPRAAAPDWQLVEAMFGLTLKSVLAQTDEDFSVIVAGHDQPSTIPADPRVSFLSVEHPVELVRPDNRDRGRKAAAIDRAVIAAGGGLMMFVDADDWVDRRLVETARALIGRDHIGAVVDRGFAIDLKHLVAVALPHPDVFPGDFHRVCGSSVILQVCPDDGDWVKRNPFAHLHEHHRCLEVADDLGAAMIRLPVQGGYLVNTSANHSETQGPFSAWRRSFNDAVADTGVQIDQAFASRFGLDLDAVRAVSRMAGGHH